MAPTIASCLPQVLLAVLRSMSLRDTHTYFTITKKAPYFLAAVMAIHIQGMRKQALMLTGAAYGEMVGRGGGGRICDTQSHTKTHCPQCVTPKHTAHNVSHQNTLPTMYHTKTHCPQCVTPKHTAHNVSHQNTLPTMCHTKTHCPQCVTPKHTAHNVSHQNTLPTMYHTWK